jgi:hypothetical protein
MWKNLFRGKGSKAATKWTRDVDGVTTPSKLALREAQSIVW